MKLEEIKELMKAMEENTLSSMEYHEGEVHLSLRRGEGGKEGCGIRQEEERREAGSRTVSGEASGNGALKTPESRKSPNTETREKAESSAKPDQVISSPLVGTFYAAPSPEEAPFVKAGDRVKKGQVLGIIEAMKLMNEIEAEFDGTVEAVLVENEAMVEFGQPLFRIA